MNADLHTHTDCSDGSLPPARVLAAAQVAGVELLAFTDHDTVAAYDALAPGTYAGVRLVPGIELSTRWRRIGVHVVGLNFDLGDPGLRAGVERQQCARAARAGKIAARLARLGIPDALAGAQAAAGGRQLGRPHFATHLVATGFVRDPKEAFRKYLGAGKAGDVRGEWVSLEDAVAWIREAGGDAVLAHPAKYRLTRTRLGELVADFASASGNGLEVVTGRQSADVTDGLARLARRHGLLASCGSDFHRPDAAWSRVGGCSALPASCAPVWRDW